MSIIMTRHWGARRKGRCRLPHKVNTGLHMLQWSTSGQVTGGRLIFTTATYKEFKTKGRQLLWAARSWTGQKLTCSVVIPVVISIHICPCFFFCVSRLALKRSTTQIVLQCSVVAELILLNHWCTAMISVQKQCSVVSCLLSRTYTVVI